MHINLLLAPLGVEKCKKTNRLRERNWIFWPKRVRICFKNSVFLDNIPIFEPLHCSWLKNKYHIWKGEVLTISKHSLLLSEVKKLSEKWVFYFCKSKQKYLIFYVRKVTLLFLQYCFHINGISHTILHPKWKVRGVLKSSEPQRIKSVF